MNDATPAIGERIRHTRERLANHSRENVVIAEMWVWHDEFVRQARIFAEAKTFHGREVSKVIVRERANGEKSAAVAAQTAELDDEIYNAHAAYRLAEQLVTGAREALKILHAELEKIRTERADQRAADQFTARTGT